MRTPNITTAEDFFNNGLVKYLQEDFLGAIEDFTNAINLNPDQARAYYFRHQLYMKVGNVVAAWADFKKWEGQDNPDKLKKSPNLYGSRKRSH